MTKIKKFYYPCEIEWFVKAVKEKWKSLPLQNIPLCLVVNIKMRPLIVSPYASCQMPKDWPKTFYLLPWKAKVSA